MNVFEKTAKINAGLAFLASLAGAAAWTQPAVAGSDLWWHLASGRDIWASGRVPSVDGFSFTFAGERWLNHEWLWDVGVWAAWSVHPQLVAWGNLALLLGLFALVFAVARQATGSLLAAGATTWIIAAGGHWFFDIRPHVLTLLGVALLLLIRERSWAAWAWPPILVLWANLHAGFVFGACAIGLDVLLRTVLGSWRARRLVLPRREWLGLGLGLLLALILNPFGPRILEYPLAYLDRGSGFRSLREWLPFDFSLDPRSYAGRFWWTAALAALGVRPLWKRCPYCVALPLVTFAMALVARRFIPLFGVSAVPLIALGLTSLATPLRRRLPLLERPAAGTAATACALVVAALWLSGVRFDRFLLERWTQFDFYPHAGVRYLEALGPPERVLNLYIWGGFLMLHVPGSQVFIDGRANTVYDEEILRDYIAISNGYPGAQARMARHGPEVALVDAQGAFSGALRAGGWRRIYMDAVAEILAPPGSPLLERALPTPADVVGAEPQFRVEHGRRLALRGQPDAAVRVLAEVIAEHPLHVSAYGELAYVHALRGDADAVGRAIDTGLRELPRRWDSLYDYGGRAFERAGHLPRALHAYRKTLPAGPFHPGAERRGQIERLEQRIANPAAPGG